MICPGSLASASTFSASNKTRRCPAASPFWPSGWPKGYLTKTARGGRSFSVTSRTIERAIVAIPSRSRTSAIRATARLQLPQAGVTSAALTPAALSLEATSRAEASIAGTWVSSARCPIKL
jgi:hypothetical protein